MTFPKTPHINILDGAGFGKTVLMPGDPLRSKFIAENFLEDAKCYNEVRGMLGFTGTNKGVPVSESIQKEFIALRDECGLDYRFPFEN